MIWPPLPKSIMGLAGPIRIDRPLVVDPKNPSNIGMYFSDERRVSIQSTLNREVAWLTLLHELGHAALSEAGTPPMSYQKEESVVEACASGTMHVLRWLLQYRAKESEPQSTGRTSRSS